jgi:lipopolysaccharide transport system permease protein
VIEPSRGAVDWFELWRYRDLFWAFVERDIRLRYRQTFLGIAWVILQPLAASAIFATVFGAFAGLPSDGVPYFLFVFAGILPWNLFSGGVQRAGNSLVANAALVTKIYFPREIIPASSAFAVVLDFAVAGLLFLAALVVGGRPLFPTMLALPLFAFLALSTSVGVSLLFSALNVYYRDFAHALQFVLQVWLFATPVAYSSTLIPAEWSALYGLNPMVGVIEGFRWATLGGAFPALHVLEAALLSALLLALGATVFERVERSFADVI